MGFIKYGADGILKEYEKENQFYFPDELILPAEQQEYVANELSKQKGGSNKAIPLTEKERIEHAKVITDLLQSCNGKIKGSVYSRGGSSSTTTDEKEDMVKYTIINIEDIAIFEAMAQKDNATFMGIITESFEEDMKTLNRTSIQEKGMYKICHESNDGKYNTEHLISLLKMCIEDKELLMHSLKSLRGAGDKKYCYLGTLIDKYNSLKLSGVPGGQTTVKDVAEAYSYMMNQELELEPEKEDKTHE